MSFNIAIRPYRFKASERISFEGKAKPKNDISKDNVLPMNPIKTPKNRDPGNLPDISFFMRKKIIDGAHVMGISNDDYLRLYLGHLAYKPAVIPEPSITAKVGQATVTTLIDGEQIFQKTVEYIKNAKSSILIEMFEFQNLKVDGHKWPTNGADVVPGFKEQQSILSMLISKKRETPNIKIQVILDAHKWYMDGHGTKERHYNNQDMIRYLKQNGIDVVPYPRAAQQGAALQHKKLLAVDGRKVILGGMNWGTHSSANHDACIAIETLPQCKNSEVDNIIEYHFNADWKFAWQRLKKTKLIAGPLTKDEQKFYYGLKKEIKEENVEYMRLVGDLFKTSENRNRYDEKDLSKLELTPTNPIKDPAIKVLGTMPKELSLVGKKGTESTRKYLMDKLRTCKKVQAELFVLSDKELIETVIKRVKNKELEAQFIVSSEILEEFPYCRRAYNVLVKNGVPVRLYNCDETINQRLHCKWGIFDDNEILIGSTNWSAMGLNQNLKTGKREDYELHALKIDEEISGYLVTVKDFEYELGIPPLSKKKFDYNYLIQRRKEIKKALHNLNKFGATKLCFDNKELCLTDKDKSTLQTVQGYYGIVKDRYNAKEKYKRGNNECAVAFVSPVLAKVFAKQFKKDWQHSEDDFDKIRNKMISVEGTEMPSIDLVG